MSSCCRFHPFLVVLCLFAALSNYIAIGLIAGSVSSLQLRYNLDSTQIGLLVTIYEIVVVVLVLLIGYFGTHGHRPRILAIGALLVGIGSFIFGLPQLIGGKYSFVDDDNADICGDGMSPPENCGASNREAYALFVTGFGLVGIGSATLFTLGPVHLDHTSTAGDLPRHLSYFWASVSLGPAFGLLVMGLTLTQWVDPGVNPENIDPDDSNWVGRWWVGWFIATGWALVCALLMAWQPRGDEEEKTDKPFSIEAPSSRGITIRGREEEKFNDKEQQQANEQDQASDLAGLIHDSGFAKIRDLLRPVLGSFSYMCVSVAIAAELFVIAGAGVFIAQIIQSKFRVSASAASLYVAAVIVAGGFGGSIVGGQLSSCLRLTPRQNALMCWIVALLATPVFLGNLISCGQLPLAGVTVDYNPNNNGNDISYTGLQLDSFCNQGCDCSRSSYFPVCGNGITYFSPCYAGCRSREGSGASSCTCVASDPFNIDVSEDLTVTNGKCEEGCGTQLFIYLGLVFLAIFLTLLNNVPATVVSLKSVPKLNRPIALSVQQIVFRAIGSIPGPLVFGAVIDSSCQLWSESCGSRGSCLEYRDDALSLNLTLLTVIPKAVSAIMFFFAWWTFPNTPEADIRPGDEQRAKAVERAREQRENKEEGDAEVVIDERSRVEMGRVPSSLPSTNPGGGAMPRITSVSRSKSRVRSKTRGGVSAVAAAAPPSRQH